MSRNLWPETTTLPGLSDHQRSELAKSLTSPVGLLRGFPGVGKTYVVAALIRAIIAIHGAETIRMAALAGLAAQRMTASLRLLDIDSIAGTTIHRLLEVGRNGHDQQGWGFRRNEFNPLACRFLFLDEDSSIDCDLFASVMRACPPGLHLLMTGDLGQLPSVSSGSPARDAIASGVCGIGRLTEIHRNAGDIVLALKAIREGKPAKPSQSIDIAGGSNWKHFECGSSVSSLARLSAMLAAPPSGINPIWDVQVICALNDKGDLNRETLNDRIQSLVNGGRETILKRGKNEFKVGDKVMGIKNTLMGVATEWPEYREPDEDNEETGQPASDAAEEFVANGELGEVVGLSSDGKWFGVRLRMSGKIVVTKVFGGSGDGESAGFQWQLAYAVTCHKFQGSQAKIVATFIDEAATRMASREWWTTALSRPQDLLFTIGKLSTLHRQCRREVLSGRKTLLVEKLKGEMVAA